MCRLLPRLALLCAFALFAAGSAQAAPCAPAPDGAIVCGEGEGAMRVLSDTASPDLRFAVAWRERDNPGSGEPDPENVENLLVRLRDGAVLLALGGNHWETAKLRANCQSAPNFDPSSACNFDPLERRVLEVALAPSELAGVAETARARFV